MIDLLRRYGATFLAGASNVALSVRSVLDKIQLCRTEALRGRTYECSGCGYRSVVHNSCGERHCPQCAGARRADWAAGHEELLLPGLDFFQVVFTLPDKLSRLVLGNRRELYRLLFHAAWRALRGALRRQNISPAALLVLHTWNQELGHHPHIHALVPGGGPSLNPDNDVCWVTARDETRAWRARPSLTDVAALGESFRGAFIRGLSRLIRRGRLKLTEEWRQLESRDVLSQWLKSLGETDWNVYIEGPPQGDCDPRRLLHYLTRYLTGGPISDRRIVADEHGMVKFVARANSRSGGGRGVRTVELPGAEFVRRWSLHVLPKGFARSRCYGGYHGRRRQEYLATCRRLLGQAETMDDEPAPPAEFLDPPAELMERPSPECPRCKIPMLCVAADPRPSWRDLLGCDGRSLPTEPTSSSRPAQAGPSHQERPSSPQLPRPET